MKQSAGDKTKEKILTAGVELWPNVTPFAVARKIGMTHPAVLYHFPNNLSDAVAEHAVKIGASSVVVQLMAANHPAADKLSAAERIRHFNAI